MQRLMLLLLILAVTSVTAQNDPAQDQRVLFGRYDFEEEGLVVDVSLNADSTAVYGVGGGVGIRAEGAWDVRG